MRNKNITVLFALFFWGIGLHRFYLWNYFIGVVYILFCWTFVPMAISIIEAFYFLFLKKEQFDKIYNMDFLIKEKQYEYYQSQK